MSELKETTSKQIPEINVLNCNEEINNSKLNNSWETCSIGSADDLINELEAEEKTKLGWNLPTNDKTKAGTLDDISVDSYWVEDEEIENIEKAKEEDPVNPDYKAVYQKVIIKYNKNKDTQQAESVEILSNKNENDNQTK
jgi:hypothetical protein